MNKKDNRRLQITKQLLRESLLELLQTEDIHKISIRALCEHANVNRSTFYKHYGSQYDLLHDMEELLILQVEQQLTSNGEVVAEEEILINILTFFKNNLDLCKMLINSNIDPDFPKRILYLPSILEKIKLKITDEHIANSLYFHDYILYGEFQMIKRWINNGCIESPVEMAQILNYAFQKLSF
ncbi:MAG TPA: TetR/AcrR family transcriptional regulator [Lachnospiraceae bacterium]|nr:TetR/AcrR family transcriptional regulator [Lachnospiraceae bacterium]